MDVFQGCQVRIPVGVGVGVGANVVPDVDLHVLDDIIRIRNWNKVSVDVVPTTEGDLQL